MDYYTELLKQSPEDIYQAFLAYDITVQYDNAFMCLIMAANLGHKLAAQTLLDREYYTKIHKFARILQCLKATSEYSYSTFGLGVYCIDEIEAIGLYEKAIALDKHNVCAIKMLVHRYESRSAGQLTEALDIVKTGIADGNTILWKDYYRINERITGVSVVDLYIDLQKENAKLQAENQLLKSHIAASPDGDLFKKAYDEWMGKNEK